MILLTLLLIGLLTGIIFSIPITGPIGIIITTNALKGKQKFCNRLSLGASIIEFFYVFIGVYGLATLYDYYKDYLQYFLIVGAIFIFILSIKIFFSKIDLNPNTKVEESKNAKGGFLTGIMLNITNPVLLFGWLSTSFIVLSFVSSIGIEIGGLDLIVEQNINQMEGDLNAQNNNSNLNNESAALLGFAYSFGVALGSYLWFVFFAHLIIKYKKKIKDSYLQNFIKFLAICLFGLGIYLLTKTF
jgi:threonine/homoserine/homoserine lactone efflux protein